MLLYAALLAALAAIAVAAAAMRQSARARKELESARSRLARIDDALPRDAQPRTINAKALRREVRVSFEVNEARADRAVIVQLLMDFRDLSGAEEAIYWRWLPDRECLMPTIWSSEGTRPAFFSITEWAPLVQCSAEQGVVQIKAQEETVRVGAAPIQRGETLMGVLSLTHRTGLSWTQSSLRDWLPRLADQLGTVQELVDVRRRHTRDMRQGQALLDAVQRLQGNSTGDGLTRAFCETAVEVSGARSAALVRWSTEGDGGEIAYATEGTGLRAPAPLDGASIVGEACRAGKLQVLEDTRTTALGRGIYGVPRTVQEPGSVAIVPIVREDRILGAIVLEAGEAKALTLEEARNLTVLAALVASSLELAWQFSEVDRRARTDPLTGLWNRQHFGEQLQQALSVADRRGSPVSLVLVDIDHFKRVNDTWGHQAGDAVLKQVARMLQDGVREIDICVRYGGEEIALLLPDADSQSAVDVADRLRLRICAQPIRHGAADIQVTASFGVATYPETVKARDQLFPAADKALYIAKHEGRNRVRAKPATRGRTAG
jgi:diguanylate cyclase (GGDEF)-like protein